MSRGTGQHPSAGAAALAVKDALHQRITTAITASERARLTAALAAGERAEADGTDPEVDVAYGFRWPARWPDAAAVTAVRVVPEAGTLGPRQRRHATVEQDVNVAVWRVTDDEQVPHERAFALLSVIEEAVRDEPTLGGVALWCVQGRVESEGATVEDTAGDGRLTEIVATFESRVVITS